MTREGTKNLLLIFFAVLRVVKNLSEQSEVFFVPLDIYADLMNETYPNQDWRAVRALHVTGGTRLTKVDGQNMEDHDPTRS